MVQMSIGDTANGHMTLISAEIESTNLSLKNSTNLSLKHSRVQMSLDTMSFLTWKLQQTLQWVYRQVCCTLDGVKRPYTAQAMPFTIKAAPSRAEFKLELEITNLSLKNSRVQMS